MSFRWEWVLVPLACLVTIWMLSVIQPACRWDGVMTALHVQDRAQYTMLACLGCGVVAIVAVARIVRRREEDE